MAAEGTAAAFEDVRRRELQTWATVLRCRDDDGPMPELTPCELARLAVSITDVDIRDTLVGLDLPGDLTLDLVPGRCGAIVRASYPPRGARRRPGARPGTEHSARRSGWSAGSSSVRRVSRGLDRRPH